MQRTKKTLVCLFAAFMCHLLNEQFDWLTASSFAYIKRHNVGYDFILFDYKDCTIQVLKKKEH